MEIPCGQCAGCRLERARQWAIRCIHEASLYDQNCFLTLTYSPEHVPPDGSLRPRDIVLFFKRLRKLISPGRVRYFQCGEYGTQFLRPHHHILCFGYAFPDRTLVSSGKFPIYTSAQLATLWPWGFHSIGDITFDSACYTARYILKKVTGDAAEEHYQGRKPEYITMSRRPGIGRDWYDRFKDDLYNYDKCVVKDSFVAKPPKYYDKLLESAHNVYYV
jgi:hypothetical protein